MVAVDRLLQPVMDGYFFDKYLVSAGDNKVLVDMKNNSITSSEGSEQFFNVTLGNSYSTMKHFTNQACKVMNIGFATKANGNVTVSVERYANPQINNGIKISMDKNIEQGVGLLLRNYKPRLMQIPTLQKVPAKLLKTLKKHKNPYTTKSIKKSNESWLNTKDSTTTFAL